MGYLSARNFNFAQVVAVDAEFCLFTRAWCVSELAKAHACGMRQHLKILNTQTLQTKQRQLCNLRIENMKASRPEDVAEILAAIPDTAAFNKEIQHLLIDKLIPAWNNLDACEQMSII